MSRKCGTCGAPVSAGASLFCNKCGARLPAEIPQVPLTCPRCGKTLTDRLSRFCDRCGTAIPTPVQPLPPVIPVVQGKDCPHCGFGNLGTDIFYCKKCGTSLVSREPPMAPGVRQEIPAGSRGGSGVVPAGRTVTGKAEPREKPQSRQKVPRESVLRSHRKAIIGVVVVILVLIAVAFIMTGKPILPGTGQANSSTPSLPAAQSSTSEPGAGPAGSSTHSLPVAQSSTSEPGAGPASSSTPSLPAAQSSRDTPPWLLPGNQATTVVTDIPLNPK
jgi:hypothetical protein